MTLDDFIYDCDWQHNFIFPLINIYIYILIIQQCNVIHYLLFYRSKDAVKHFTVRYDGESFTFGFGKFSTVQELLSHFESKPVIGGDSGKPVLIL